MTSKRETGLHRNPRPDHADEEWGPSDVADTASLLLSTIEHQELRVAEVLSRGQIEGLLSAIFNRRTIKVIGQESLVVYQMRGRQWYFSEYDICVKILKASNSYAQALNEQRVGDWIDLFLGKLSQTLIVYKDPQAGRKAVLDLYDYLKIGNNKELENNFYEWMLSAMRTTALVKSSRPKWRP